MKDPIKTALWIFAIFVGVISLLGLCACSTTIKSPTTGKDLLVMRSDLTNVKFTGGGVTFSADTVDNSTPTYTALFGTKGLVDSVGTTAVALGLTHGTSSVASKLLPAAATSVPHISLPKATPIPLSLRRPVFASKP